MKNVKEAKVKQDWTRVMQYLAYFTQSCLTLCGPKYSPWNSPGQNTGVGSLSLLQQIFPTQEFNWGLLHCRQILYHWAIREALLTCSLRVIIHFKMFSFNSYWYIKWNGNIGWNRDRCPALLTRSRLLNLFGSILFFLWCLKIIFLNVVN